MLEQESPEADTLARLIRAAGRREQPPDEVYQRALAVATAAWRAKTRRRQRRVVGWMAAGAAAVTTGVWLASVPQLTPAPPIARVERIIGTADQRAGQSGVWAALRDDSPPLAPGTMLRTLEGSRIGIVLAGNVSLRLADNTSVTLESASRVRLSAGKVYVDTGSRDGRGVVVLTDAGAAFDVGTQFEVLYRDRIFRLRVREGEVRLQRDAAQLRGRAGEQLSINAGGEISRASIAADDLQWQWVQTVAPAPEIDDQPLTVLLEWVARETGHAIRFASPEVERRAAATILHGDIRHLAPLQALSIMLATTDLQQVSLPDGTIMIK